MSTVDAAPLLAALASADAPTARESARRCLKLLRDRQIDPALVAPALLPLASHADARLRKLVAEAAEHLPDEAADAVLPALAADHDAFVKESARLSRKRVTARRAAADRKAAAARKHAARFAAIGQKDGDAARARAEVAARSEADDRHRALRHELTKLLIPLDRCIRRAQRELDKPRLSRAALGAELARALEEVRALTAILASGGARFREERLAPIVERACDDLRDRLGPRAKDLALTIDVPASLVAEVDPDALLQAFQNVLENAAEASAETGRIAVRVAATAAPSRGEVELVFVDEGPGITKEQVARLFAGEGSAKPGGSGLGVRIARTMVEEIHGGVFRVASEPGRGTSITIAIPARQRPASS